MEKGETEPPRRSISYHRNTKKSSSYCNFEIMATPSKEPPRMATWELICRDLYTRNEKRSMLGYPTMTKRDIDQTFLERALVGRLFTTQEDYNLLRRKLRYGGFSENLVALTVLRPTPENLVKAQEMAQTMLKDCCYDDDNDDDNDENDQNSKRKDTTITNDGNLKKSRLEPIKKNIHLGLRFGKSVPLDDPDKEEPSCIALQGEATVKVPHHLRYQYKRNFRIIMVVLAVLAGIGFHLLLWNLFGRTGHGLRGQRYNPRFWRGFSTETVGHPRLDKDHGTSLDAKHED